MSDRYIVAAMNMTNAEDRRPPEQHERVVILEADHVAAVAAARAEAYADGNVDGLRHGAAAGIEQGQRDAINEHLPAWEKLVRDAYAEGQRDGIKAARDVVEAQEAMWGEDTLVRMGIKIGLAAIDALEKP